MKIAVMKIGARIHNNDKIGSSSNEVLATIKMLKLGGASVIAFTHKIKSDKDCDFIKNYNEFFDNINDFDRLVIINGNVNFFGGVCSDESPEIYRAINIFKRPIIYMLYDPYLGVKQCYKSVLSKDWGKIYTKEDLEIKENCLNYITQCKNTHLINEVGQKSCNYYPIEKFPLITENIMENLDYDNAEFDLIYAGTFRGGRRKDYMLKYYFNLPDDIRAQMFGNIKLEQFNLDYNIRAPEFGKAVTHDKVKENLQKGLATVIIGDPLYIKLDDIAQRFYESIIYGQVTFIDAEYDSNHRAYHNKKLLSFLTVSSKEELVKKLRYIKNNKEFFKKVIKAQQNDEFIKIDKLEYCKNLIKLIENIGD